MLDAHTDANALARRRLDTFERDGDTDLFAKCQRFGRYMDELRALGTAQVQYRVEVVGPLDAQILVRDRGTGKTRKMLCFDSNSYLGLHLDPRVISATKRAVDDVGIGTPSAQVLGGTNRYLLALEELLADLLGRERAMIYPSGYQANVAILTALLGEDDIAVVDRMSHASIHDGVRYAGARSVRYPYRDTSTLEAQLGELRSGANGALIVSDGVFSMHGGLADLPTLRGLADDHRAGLMIDDAHSLGVIGQTGRGIEEHYGMRGACDVLMGTFSKAPGAAGGYVCGDAALIDYMRFISRGGLFTAALPAPTCAGLTKAIEIMCNESKHRERLWANARRMHSGLRANGMAVPPLESPILAVPVGDERWLIPLSLALYDAGIKCGVVRYPAVPYGESVLRFTVNARHTEAQVDYAVEALEGIWRDLRLEAAEGAS